MGNIIYMFMTIQPPTVPVAPRHYLASQAATFKTSISLLTLKYKTASHIAIFSGEILCYCHSHSFSFRIKIKLYLKYLKERVVERERKRPLITTMFTAFSSHGVQNLDCTSFSDLIPIQARSPEISAFSLLSSLASPYLCFHRTGFQFPCQYPRFLCSSYLDNLQ